jgi:hypothetical protein
MYCLKSDLIGELLIKHWQEQHLNADINRCPKLPTPNERQYNCRVCQENFKTTRQLKTHILRNHTAEKLYCRGYEIWLIRKATQKLAGNANRAKKEKYAE